MIVQPQSAKIIDFMVKHHNHAISSERVLSEHIIGLIKRFKIMADKYRNRRKCFGLRFNLIAGICNYERL